MPSVTGKLIIIEGLEGAGKSTAVTTVIDLLTRYKIKTITTREPGGTPIGESLRDLIKDPTYKDVLDDRSELLLMYAARIQLLEQVIKPALKEGIWVVADRFELSSMAYQGGGRGLDANVIKQLSAFALNAFKPNLTLYLDISPEEGMKRVRTRGASDRIEQQSIEFFHRVHQCYIQQIQNNPEIVIVDASLSLEEVQQSIQKGLNQFIEHLK